jgi:hypothetical protein
MIQRIQSVLLLDVVFMSVLLLFFPFIEYRNGEDVVLLSLMPGTFAAGVKSFIYVPVALNIVVALLALITIFQYKNRIKQARLAKVTMLLAAFLLTSMLTMSFYEGEKSGYVKTYLWPSFLPIISVISAFVAARFIKKDEELVRSADRIR